MDSLHPVRVSLTHGGGARSAGRIHALLPLLGGQRLFHFPSCAAIHRCPIAVFNFNSAALISQATFGIFGGLLCGSLLATSAGAGTSK
jgi:hypothetical protein